MKDIDKKVDALIQNTKAVSKPKRKRTIRKGLAIGIALLMIMGAVLGVLITYYSTYYADIEGNIDLTGQTADVYYDGVGWTTQTLVDTQDIVDLSYGQTLTESHTLESEVGNGVWNCTFDLSGMADLYDEVTDEFYGYDFRVLDNSDSDITTSGIILNDGTTITIKYEHSLDEFFLDTSNPFPFDLQIILEELFAWMVGFYGETHASSETIQFGLDSTGTDLIYGVYELDDTVIVEYTQSNPTQASDWDAVHSNSTITFGTNIGIDADSSGTQKFMYNIDDGLVSPMLEGKVKSVVKYSPDTGTRAGITLFTDEDNYYEFSLVKTPTSGDIFVYEIDDGVEIELFTESSVGDTGELQIVFDQTDAEFYWDDVLKYTETF